MIDRTASPMNAPADRTATRTSREEWFTRYDSVDLLKSKNAIAGDRKSTRTSAPADRLAVRT